MVPLVNLAVISKSGEKTLFYKYQLVFLHLLYTIAEKEPYLMSTISYQLSVKNFIAHMHPILMVFTKIT